MVKPIRRDTPAGVARQLRQEAGFGCCVCGVPILQYHHIVEWAEEEHFRPEDMMVLCPLHHDQATKGAMPEQDQRRYKSSPKNIERNLASGLLAIRQNYCAADFGSVQVVGEGTFLEIDGEPILGFHLGDNHNLEVTLRLFSEADELLLEIDRNEWKSGDPLPWDIEADWQVLTLRERQRKISVSINGKAIPLEFRAEMWRSGTAVRIEKNGIFVPGKLGIQELALVGMKLVVDLAGMKVGPQPESAGGVIVSWPNRRERLWKAKESWERISRN